MRAFANDSFNFFRFPFPLCRIAAHSGRILRTVQSPGCGSTEEYQAWFFLLTPSLFLHCRIFRGQAQSTTSLRLTQNASSLPISALGHDLDIEKDIPTFNIPGSVNNEPQITCLDSGSGSAGSRPTSKDCGQAFLKMLLQMQPDARLRSTNAVQAAKTLLSRPLPHHCRSGPRQGRGILQVGLAQERCHSFICSLA